MRVYDHQKVEADEDKENSLSSSTRNNKDYSKAFELMKEPEVNIKTLLNNEFEYKPKAPKPSEIEEVKKQGDMLTERLLADIVQGALYNM